MQERPDAQQSGHHPAAPGREAEDVPGGSSEEEAGSDSRTSSEAAAEEVERDLEALEETRRERDEYLDLAKRTKADFENYRKRVSGEADSARRRGKSELAAELVPVLDNLERALAAAGIDPAGVTEGDSPREDPLEQGVMLTYRDLRETLQRAGVEPYEPDGEKFDPEWHEALSTRPDETAGPGLVLEVVQKGYRLDGQVIRPARVVVSE